MPLFSNFLVKFCKASIIWLLVISLVACHSSNAKLYKKLSKEDAGNNHYLGHYKIGNQYKIKNKSYKPMPRKKYKQIGMASWYGSKHGFHGKKTANGDKYNKNTLTAAHPELPMPSLIKVTNLKNNKSVILMVNDRGPFSKKRILDVSERAATLLGFKNEGIAKVEMQYLHSETQKFIQDLRLSKKEGSRANNKLAKNKCSVNCHIKLVNMKYKLATGS